LQTAVGIFFWTHTICFIFSIFEDQPEALISETIIISNNIAQQQAEILPPFIQWMVEYHPYNNIMIDHIGLVDFYVLRFSSKILYRILPTVLVHKKTPLVNWVLENRYFVFANWLQRKKFYYEKHILHLTHVDVVWDQREEKLQKKFLNKNFRNLSTVSSFATYMGNFDLLKWVVGKGYKVHKECVAVVAVRTNNIIILKWLVSELKCPIKENAAISAFSGGSIEMVEYIYNLKLDALFNRSHFLVAMKHGHIHLLKWLLKRVGPLWNGDVFDAAVELGNWEYIQWLKESGCPNCTNANKIAIQKNDLSLLKYLRSLGVPWDKITFSIAASNGNLEILKYLFNSGCPWDDTATLSAAEKGHFECLKYLHEKGIPLHFDVASVVALLPVNKYSVEDMIEYLVVNNCPKNEKAVLNAANTGQINLIEFLLEKKFPFSPRLTNKVSNLNGLKWLHKNKFPLVLETFNNCAQNGDIAACMWLNAHGCPWDATTTARAAVSGNLEVVKFLHKSGCPWDSRVYRAARNCAEILQYAEQNHCPKPEKK
jgi:hypothetical protein